MPNGNCRHPRGPHQPWHCRKCGRVVGRRGTRRRLYLLPKRGTVTVREIRAAVRAVKAEHDIIAYVTGLRG